VLLGRLPTARMLLGTGLVALFLAVAVAVVALAAVLVRATVVATGLASGAPLALGILGGLGGDLARGCPPRCWSDDRPGPSSAQLPAGHGPEAVAGEAAPAAATALGSRRVLRPIRLPDVVPYGELAGGA